MGRGGRVGGVIFMSLFYYTFPSILNTFAFCYFFGGKKLIIFTDGGYPPPFAENNWYFRYILDVGIGGEERVGGVIFMSLLYYMFQSILNTFAFGYFFGGKKLIIFTDGGYPPPLRGKFRENN